MDTDMDTDIDEGKLCMEDILNIMLVIRDVRPSYLVQLNGVDKKVVKKRLKDIRKSFPNIIITPVQRTLGEDPYEFLISKEKIDIPVPVTDKFLRKTLGYLCKYNEENAVSFYLNIPIFGYTCSSKDIKDKVNKLEKIREDIRNVLNVYPNEIEIKYKKEESEDEAGKIVSVKYLTEDDLPSYKNILKKIYGYKKGDNVGDLELLILKAKFNGNNYTIITHMDGPDEGETTYIDESSGEIMKNKGLKKWFLQKSPDIFPISAISFHHIDGKVKVSREKALKKIVKGLHRYFGDSKPKKAVVEDLIEEWLNQDAETYYSFAFYFETEEDIEEIIKLYNNTY